MTKTSNTFNGISKNPNAPINWELNFCEICHQMTNHFREHCLKCRAREGKPRITEFNKDMSEDERNYYGEKYNERR